MADLKSKKILFYPIDLDYKVIAGKPIIYLYGRTKEGKQICVKDKTFEPYFYVSLTDDSNVNEVIKKIQETEIDKRGYEGKVERIETVKREFRGKDQEFLQVFTNIPKAVAAISKEVKDYEGVKRTFEYDIHFTRRYLMDKQIIPLTLTEVHGDFVDERNRVPVFNATHIENNSSETYDPQKILAFDIECYNPLGKVIVPEKFPIVMIAFYGKNYKKVLTWKRFKTNHDYIEFVDGEAELLTRFKEIVNEQSPDLLTGYYSDGFDLPYILTRAAKYKLKMDFNLDYSPISTNSRGETSVPTIGIVHLDIISFIRRIISRKLKTDSLKLDLVAEELLGERKDDVDLNLLAKYWDEGAQELETYCVYNLQDAKLTHDLTEKILPNLIEMVKLIGQPIAAVNKMSFSQLVEWFLMRRTKDFNMIIENRPGYDKLTNRRGEKVKGAFVFEPTPGLYHGVTVFDFRSLYPTIIVSHNISPETINCECCENEVKHVPIDNKNLWFCKKKEGFYSSVLKEVITRRMRVKELLKTAEPEKKALLDARQESLKVLANSFYGYLGFYAARWYSKDCARSVTGYGRNYIHLVIDKAEEKGFQIIYSDTDSIFINLKENTTDDAKKFVEDINNKLPGMMELEYEGFYPAALFVSVKESDEGAKKKYALLDDTGKIMIKGFEAIRRNWSTIAKEVQLKVIDILLKEDNPKKAYDYVKEIIQQLRKRELPIDKVIIKTQLTKPIASYDSIGPHVAAAKRMQARGDEVIPGMIIQYVITVGKGLIRERAKLPDELDGNDYDPDYYINHQILPSVDKIFVVFGYSKEDLAEKKEQSKLDSFFGS